MSTEMVLEFDLMVIRYGCSALPVKYENPVLRCRKRKSRDDICVEDNHDKRNKEEGRGWMLSNNVVFR